MFLLEDEKKGVSREQRKSFSLALGSPSFQACTDCASCQRTPEKLLLLYLFILFFMLLGFYISYLIPTSKALTEN